jgi:hypothetical protein
MSNETHKQLLKVVVLGFAIGIWMVDSVVNRPKIAIVSRRMNEAHKANTFGRTMLITRVLSLD